MNASPSIIYNRRTCRVNACFVEYEKNLQHYQALLSHEGLRYKCAFVSQVQKYPKSCHRRKTPPTPLSLGMGGDW